MQKFEKTFEVKWADVDQNRHVRHSAYNDYAAYVRIRFITEAGFGANKLEELNLGPILFKEECSFIKEIKPDDTVRVNMLNGDISENASRWKIHHEIFNQRDEKVAHITVKGAWMDMVKRKLADPPTELAKAFQCLPSGEDYIYGKD